MTTNTLSTLRLAAACLAFRDDLPELRVVADALQTVVDTAGGADLAAELGLRPHGGVPVYRAVAIEERNEALWRIWLDYYPGRPPTTAARTMAARWAEARSNFNPARVPPEPGTEGAAWWELCAQNEEPLKYRAIFDVLKKMCSPQF